MVVPVRPQLLLNALGGSASTAAAVTGGLSTLDAMVEVVSNPLLGHASDLYGRRGVLLLAQAGLIVDFGLIAAFADHWQVYVVATLVGASTGVFFMTLSTVTADLAVGTGGGGDRVWGAWRRVRGGVCGRARGRWGHCRRLLPNRPAARRHACHCPQRALCVDGVARNGARECARGSVAGGAVAGGGRWRPRLGVVDQPAAPPAGALPLRRAPLVGRHGRGGGRGRRRPGLHPLLLHQRALWVGPPQRRGASSRPSA
eukprot:TRINITY_DN1853_c0_g2_i6.p2 TRINITY_DN1853_c0_g2~~TRINITY_DN1853_c0_g2_i6.p2  ORF type:complete len:298 (-),score=58.06 TRINITY_DN1853_c0_g2_i6:1326-2096(-)